MNQFNKSNKANESIKQSKPKIVNISSLQHPLVKHLTKLRKEKAYRRECGAVLVEGKKMIAELGKGIQILRILFDSDSEPDSDFIDLVFDNNNSVADKATTDESTAEFYHVPYQVIEKICGTSSPEGIIAEVKVQQRPIPEKLKNLLILDGINDPGNLGTLIRTALAFGWEGVVLLENCCDPFNDKALRAAKGATFRIPITEMEWSVCSKKFSDHIFVAADMGGMSISDFQSNQNVALILGSEANGVRSVIIDHCQKVSIPMCGDMESLNVAVAGGIMMWSLKSR